MDAKPGTQRDLREASKAAAKAWLEEIVARTGKKPPTLARDMSRRGYRVAASTLYRILDPQEAAAPDLATIRKIEAATGFAFPWGDDDAGAPRGFAEPEATRIEAGIPAELTPGLDEGVWRVDARLLEQAGFLRGDLVLFEIGAAVVSGDLVIAQIEDRQGGAETVIRFYEAPYLVARPLDPRLSVKPLPVDGETVRIVGRFKRMLRQRRDADGVTPAAGRDTSRPG